MAGILSPFMMGAPQQFQGAQPAPMQQQAPMQQPVQAQGRFGGFREMMSPDIMMPVAAGLLSGRSNAEGFANAFGTLGQGMGQKRQRNKTLAYLQENDPEVAQLVEATGMDIKDAYAIHQQRVKAQMPEQTAGMREYEFAKQQGYQGSFMDWKAQGGGSGGSETHGTPFFTKDADGNLHVNFASKSGDKLIRASAGEGEQVLGPYDTSFDRSRGQAEGKGQGEAWESYRSMTSKLPGLQTVVSRLDDLAGKATYTLGGQALDAGMKQLGMEPRDAAIARAEYTAMISNQILPLLRDTFGAQFTQREGETLMRTLGDPDASPAEKQALLKAFIEQKQRDIEALALRTGQTDGAPMGSPAGGAPDPLGIR